MKDEQKDQSENNVESGRDSSEKSQLNQPKLSGQLDQENAQPVAKRNRRPVDRLDRSDLRRDRKDGNGKGKDNQEIAHVLYLLPFLSL